MKSNLRLPKPPPPKYHYRLATVSGPQAAYRMERALRDRLAGFGLSLFSVSRGGEDYHVTGDSGASPLDDDILKKARAVAAKIKETWSVPGAGEVGGLRQ